MIELPFLLGVINKPSSRYLVALSTPHGIMQHTMYNLPDPDHGYATDDNARALIVAHMWKNIEEKDVEVMRNLETAYLRFLKFTQNQSGEFYCYMSFDMQKTKPGTGDWFGRAFFALSFITHRSKKFGTAAFNMVRSSLPLIFSTPFSPRTMAFVILGIYYLLKKDERETILSSHERKGINKILKQYAVFFMKASRYCREGWFWPEEGITYDNGKLIQAYLMLGHLLEDRALHEIGIKMLSFYSNMTMKEGYFQAPGNRGFWVRGKKKPLYDEQALEAYSLIAAFVTAYRFTRNTEYLKKARACYSWFWGKNRLGLPLIDGRSGAVYDALSKYELNTNQGAESYLSLNLAFFSLTQKLIL